jgi:glutamate dehydrogenase/leucine dehydrogenase
MDSLIKGWDGEEVIIRHDKPTGAWILIAIHSTLLGPAAGGTRMKSYPDFRAALQDALRLAEAMTYKFAVPGISRGGGKAVIYLPAHFESSRRPDLLRRYGSLIRQLGGLYYTGPDVGTSSSDMNLIAETGSPYVFGRTPEAGGAGDSGPITALGVFAGIRVVCEHLFKNSSVKGRRILVQGAGSVGRTLMDLLNHAGAEVWFSDIDDSVVCRFRDEKGFRCVPTESVYGTECDIFSPCALGGILNATTIPQLKCKAVAGGANNQFARPEDMALLSKRGILYAPDYVINAGGAIGIPGIEALGWSKERAEKEVTGGIQGALRRIFGISESEGIPADVAARRLAEERLAGKSGALE